MTKKHLAILIFLVILTVVLCACVKNPEPEYVVTLKVDGEIIKAISVKENSLIEEPKDLQEEGKLVIGWYKDPKFNQPWDFSTDVVIENLTLYAKFESISATDAKYFEFKRTDDGYTLDKYKGQQSNVVIPDCGGVIKSIGGKAFEGNTKLTSVTIPESITKIEHDAFSGCSNLEKINFGTNSNLNTIKMSAFSGCSSLVDVVLPNSVETIETGAFESCTKLIKMIIPNSVASVGYNAFAGCLSLTIYCEATSQPSGWHSNWNPDKRPVVWGYVVGEPDTPEQPDEPIGIEGLEYTVINENEASVSDYTGTATEVTIPSTVTIDGTTYNVTKIGGSAFEDCSSLTSVTIPDSVTSIGAWAFDGCRNLTSINIPNSVTYIGQDAFLWCSSLTSITIPDSVTYIGYYTFCNCDSLTTVTIPDTVTSIGDYAFDGCSSLTSITIPDSVTSIGEGAFEDCDSLTSIIIPDSVTSIRERAFGSCSSLTSIVVDENNQNYKSIDGNLYSKDGSTLLQYASGKTDTTFTIPDSVTSIGYFAFCNCSSLTSITISDSITSIGDYAFYGFSSLTSINIPNSVTSIGAWAFAYCKNLTSITIPDSVTSIGECAFYECRNLTSITIPDSVTSIGYQVFYRCTSLTIYCEAESKPEGWDTDWNPDNRPVVWGYVVGEPDTPEQPNEPDVFTVYFYNTDSWETVNAYAWGGNTSMSWPGVAMIPV